ncbi:hypothetical protein KRE43_12775 [Elizabethkingia meningoseptica]|uniref:hypothetical protein n=1 Tax=Elizabethkingia meningoseptica TaxID=238 RepID=UPI0023B1C78D|nr:hypothetical protein [Elizabethkingia meningoseptica]MDE5530448.1 hypothetical protein [Elizabethkingia meningoseptica]MDE5534005.1 hypothetical protein [Elizabethkingia meningoseptica]MDE5542719.1 hypothetical protein [Elizabethkingia meningoseptica]
MTKNEAIKAAYGEFYIKHKPDENGWVNWNIKNDFGEENVESKVKGNKLIYRLKILRGIETNNGWISISLENIILPIDGTEVHFYVIFTNENGIQREYHKGIFNAALGFTSYYDSERYNIKEVTHYQPIEVPKPPVF